MRAKLAMPLPMAMIVFTHQCLPREHAVTLLTIDSLAHQIVSLAAPSQTDGWTRLRTLSTASKHTYVQCTMRIVHTDAHTNPKQTTQILLQVIDLSARQSDSSLIPQFTNFKD